MNLKSLGYHTDLMFRSFEGEITDKGEYLVVRTPQNPTYYWGNFLLFREAPRAGDLGRWKNLFAQEIGTPPAFKHFAFGWDEPERGDVEPFLEAGFGFQESAVLRARSVNPPPKLNQECEVRTFGPDDWAEWIELELAVNAAEPPDSRHSTEGHRTYLSRKAEEYQRMIAAGRGEWFGAYVNGKLAASLGLFVWHEPGPPSPPLGGGAGAERSGVGALGRFQSVATHPEFRRRGLCGTLVYEASRRGFEHMGAETLVMVADPEYVAIQIYQSVGFRVSERQMALQWWPKENP